MFDGSSDCVPCSDISSSPERTIILFFQNKLSKSSKQSLWGVETHQGKPEMLDTGSQPQTQQIDWFLKFAENHAQDR